jgi:hypothetical protein
MADERKDYYILDVRSVVGNCGLWWCPDGKGYTCNLDQAGLYSLSDAERQRETDVPVPRELAEKCAVRHVPLDRLRQHMPLSRRR